ncbi:MAG: hypothetical protein ACFE68_04265 [Candidatus Hodarchaeota archaeon]
MTMIEQDEERVYLLLKCQICGKDTVIPVKKSVVHSAKRYPVSVVYVHGKKDDPLHTILIYLDHEFTLRGWEFIPAVEFSREIIPVFKKKEEEEEESFLDPSLILMKVGVQNYTKLTKEEQKTLTKPLNLKINKNEINWKRITCETGITEEKKDEIISLFEKGKTLFEVIEIVGFDEAMTLYHYLSSLSEK